MKLIPYLALSTLILALLLAPTGGAYAADRDDTDRLSQNQSYTFSPGYINAAMQRAQNILKQSTEKKDSSLKQEENIDDMEAKVGQNVKQEAADKPAPQLLKKSGSSDSSSVAASTTAEYAEAPQGQVGIGTNYKVNIGTGELAHYDGSRLVSEYINGIRHIYVGFDDVGYRSDGTTKAIQAAVDSAVKGDAIIVRQGVYVGDVVMKENSRLYGGFNEQGERNTSSNPTTITGNIDIYGTSPILQDVYYPAYSYTRYRNGVMTTVTVPARTVQQQVYDESDIVELSGFNMPNSNITLRKGQLAYNRNTGTNTSNVYVMAGQLNADNLQLNTLHIGGGASVSLVGEGDYQISTLNSPAQHVLKESPSSVSGASAITNDLYRPNLSDSYRQGLDIYTGQVYGIGTSNKDALASPSLLSMKKYDRSAVAAGPLENLDIVRAIRDKMSDEGLAAYGTGNMEKIIGDKTAFVTILSGILNNPTREQKEILEAAEAILKDINNVLGESGQSPELTKAQNELIQMVANVLLAQAMPDLLKSGEMAGIRDVFKDLDTQKTKVMLNYQTATKPYYESIKKDLTKNMAILQLNNIFSKGMIEAELKNASRSDIDKIIQKLRKSSDKFFEKDYILQQEAKYRANYLDPNKKKLEADTRTMLNEFTKRLSEKLEQAKK